MAKSRKSTHDIMDKKLKFGLSVHESSIRRYFETLKLKI